MLGRLLRDERSANEAKEGSINNDESRGRSGHLQIKILLMTIEDKA